MSMFNKVTKSFQWGPHQVRMETGEIARQSSGAVLVDIEDTVVDRKSTRLNSSHVALSRMPSSA